MKIERPKWRDFADVTSQNILDLDVWFNTHVGPFNKMFDSAQVVKSVGLCWWPKEHTDSKTDWTETALLINIQPIVKETAEDVLRDLVREYDRGERVDSWLYIERARDVLGEE